MDTHTLVSILRKTPLPYIADDAILEYIRFRNMGLIGGDAPELTSPMEESHRKTLPNEFIVGGKPQMDAAYELGYKTASVNKGVPFFSDTFGPNRSIWERMIVGQLMGALPGHILGKMFYSDDPESQSMVAGTTESLGALGAIAYPEIMRALGKYGPKRPIGF